MIFRRLKSSLAFRIRPILKFLLQHRLIPRPRLQAKPEMPLKLVTMCGRSQLEMLRYSLASLHHHWTKVPAEIIVVSDGSLESAYIRKALSGIKSRLEVRTRADYLPYHSQKNRPTLVEFAGYHAFGLKLAILVKESEEGCFLWCDSDILFSGDLSDAFSRPSSGAHLRAATEFHHGYEPYLAAMLGESILAQPPVNAGFLLAESIPYDELNIETLLAACREYWATLTEQTLIAFCFQQMRGTFWKDDEMKITADDRPELFGDTLRYGWRGRHYIAPHRDLFWRDAVMFRIRQALAQFQF